ncbi:protein of unknown function DUF1725 containing protein [Cricetulus griseus]|nr:protein of unknown function DUF1725 containing protein [Cricetulus griseus]
MPEHCRRPGNSDTSIHEKRTDIILLDLFASTRREPWPHTHQEIKKLLLHPPEERMRREQALKLKFAGKWMELEETFLSEVTQTQKDKHGHSPILDFSRYLMYLLAINKLRGLFSSSDLPYLRQVFVL